MKNFWKNNPILIHKIFNGFADSLIKIFVPVLLLKETGNLFYALLFMAASPIFFVLFNTLLKRLLIKYPVWSIAIHILPMIAIQFIIFFVPINIWIILILSVLSALFSALYSVPANLLFMFSDQKLNVSKMQIGTSIGKILFILLGGLLIFSGTFLALLLVCLLATAFYILSILPLFSTEQKIHSYRAVEQTKLNQKDKRLFNIMHAAFGCFQLLMDDIIPIFLFYNGLNFTGIALLQAAIEAGRLVSYLFSHYFYKKKLSSWLIICSCVLYIVSAVLIFFMKDKIMIYILCAVNGIALPIIFVPMFKKYCELIQNKPYLMDEMSIRDSYIFGGRPVLVASYFIGFSFLAPFVLAIVSSVTLSVTAFRLLKK